MLPRIPIASRCSYICSPSVLLSRRVGIRTESELTTAVLLLPQYQQQHRHYLRPTRLPHPDVNAGIFLHPGNIKLFSSSSSSSSSTAKNENYTSLIIDQLKSFSIGSVAGLLGSLAGMGGGFVMIPMMTAMKNTMIPSSSISLSATTSPHWIGGMVRGGLGLNQHQAHGTSLFAVGTTGLAGALGYGIHLSSSSEYGEADDGNINATTTITTTTVDMAVPLIIQSHESSQQQQTRLPQQKTTNNTNKGLVELDIALALATTAMITARLGAIASSSLSERVLQRALGAFMICVAPLVTGKAYFEEWYVVHHEENDNVGKRGDKAIADKNHPNDHDDDKTDSKNSTNYTVQHQIECLLPASLIGMFSGFLSGMFGVGGGSIVVPSLVLTTNMSYHTALGTSLCAMVLPAMVGTFTHSKRGNVNWRVAPMLAMGSAMGAYFGGREIGLNVDEGMLRVGFSCLMLVLGVKTWRKGSR